MKKILLLAVLSTFLISPSYAQLAENRTFEGKIKYNGDVAVLENPNVRPEEQLSINFNFIRQKDAFLINSRCQDYCRIRGRVIRDTEYNNQYQTWWLVRTVFVSNTF